MPKPTSVWEWPKAKQLTPGQRAALVDLLGEDHGHRFADQAERMLDTHEAAEKVDAAAGSATEQRETVSQLADQAERLAQHIDGTLNDQQAALLRQLHFVQTGRDIDLGTLANTLHDVAVAANAVLDEYPVRRGPAEGKTARKIQRLGRVFTAVTGRPASRSVRSVFEEVLQVLFPPK